MKNTAPMHDGRNEEQAPSTAWTDPAKNTQTPAEKEAVDSPLMTIQGSRLRTNDWRPNRVLVFSDRLEEHDPGLLKRKIKKVRYDQIAQLGIDRGAMYATLRIESTGGATMVVKGLNKAEADKAEQAIRSKMEEARSPVFSAGSVERSCGLVGDREAERAQIR